MSDTGYAKGQCQNCDGHLEFPTAGIGMSVECPHCGSQTTLVSNPIDPPALVGTSQAGSKGIKPAAFGLVVLILILATAGAALHWFKRPDHNPTVPMPAVLSIATHSETPKQPSPAPEINDLLNAGPVTLQKTEGSALIYAVGTIRNNSDRQRFGVKIELDLLDDQDNKIGTASDYLAILEPHKDWSFRALLTQPKVVKAQVAKIEEQK